MSDDILDFTEKSLVFKRETATFYEYCDFCNIIIQVEEDFILAADKKENSSSEGMCICTFCAKAIARASKGLTE